MVVMELEIIVGDEYQQTTADMYLDVTKIAGFYVGEEEIVDGAPIKPVIVLCQGEFISLMPHPHLEEYLLDTFVNPARKNKRSWTK